MLFFPYKSFAIYFSYISPSCKNKKKYLTLKHGTSCFVNIIAIFPFPAYAGFKELGNSDYNSYSEIANFQVRGDSMQPTVKDGDYLECEKVNNNEVLNGNMYVVSLFNGESNVVKRVYVNKERQTFTLKSDNEKYPDREIQEKGVSFWLVKKVKQK